MAAILVDYENVSTTDGLKGVEYIDIIEKSQCRFKTYKLVKTGKNALDFYIAVESGILGVQGEKQISIISKDKGFSAVSDFFRIQEELDGVIVRVATNVENALVALNAPEDEARKRLIKEKTRTFSIDAEQSRIMEQAIEYEKGKGKARVKTYSITPVKEYSGKEIREIRMKAGMTQTVFAIYMGVSKKTVEAWESSRTHPTGPVFRLLDILNSDEIEETEYIVAKN